MLLKDSITWYDIHTGTTLHIPTPVNGEIATIEQTDDNHFFIGTGSRAVSRPGRKDWYVKAGG